MTSHDIASRAQMGTITATAGFLALAIGACAGFSCSTSQHSQESSRQTEKAAATASSGDHCEPELDFQKWTWEFPLPRGEHFTAAHARSADDLWLAGYGSTLVHWDGGAWTRHRVPGARSEIRDIWVGANGDIWLAAEDWLQVWRGCKWREIRTADRDSLFGDIAAFGPKDVWVAGAGATLVHWDGDAFRDVELPEEPFHEFDAEVLGGATADRLWVFDEDRGFRRRSDGSWKALQPPAPVASVTGSGPDDVWIWPEHTGDPGRATESGGPARH